MSIPLDELDRLAAEKVMGWSLTYKDELIKVDHWSKNGVLQYICRHEIKVGDYSHRFWQPTRQISQAWECLEKARFFEVSFVQDGGGTICTLRELPTTLVTGHASTTPEALVRACLKAKGVDI